MVEAAPEVPGVRWIQRLRLFVQLDRIERKCDQILVNLAREENMLMATLDDLVTDVSSQSTVVDSVVTLLQGLRDQLAAALAFGGPAKIQAVIDSIDANTAKLTAAVANSPAGTGTPPTP